MVGARCESLVLKHIFDMRFLGGLMKISGRGPGSLCIMGDIAGHSEPVAPARAQFYSVMACAFYGGLQKAELPGKDRL